MPRIAVTLGVFGLVVLALGLNIAQFPIEYRAGSPSAVSEDAISPHESTRPPTVALKPAENEPMQVRREPEQARSRPQWDEEKPDWAEPVQKQRNEKPKWEEEGLDSDDESGEWRDETPDHNEKSPDHNGRKPDRTEKKPDPDVVEPEHGEEAAREPSKPATPTGIDEEPDFTGIPEEQASEPSSFSRQNTTPATEATRQSPSDSIDPAFEPMEQYTPPVVGGIYNPLEPQPQSGGAASSGAETMATEPAAPAAPAEAVPGPPYATAGSGFITDGRVMVPIERDPASETLESNPPEQVIRLPSADNVWPGMPATAFPSDDWLPAEGYPKTQSTEE